MPLPKPVVTSPPPPNPPAFTPPSTHLQYLAGTKIPFVKVTLGARPHSTSNPHLFNGTFESRAVWIVMSYENHHRSVMNPIKRNTSADDLALMCLQFLIKTEGGQAAHIETDFSIGNVCAHQNVSLPTLMRCLEPREDYSLSVSLAAAYSRNTPNSLLEDNLAKTRGGTSEYERLYTSSMTAAYIMRSPYSLRSVEYACTGTPDQQLVFAALEEELSPVQFTYYHLVLNTKMPLRLRLFYILRYLKDRMVNVKTEFVSHLTTAVGLKKKTRK